MEKASPADYGFLRQLVFGLSQNVLDPSRDYLFDSRLDRLLRSHGMTRLEELVERLRRDKNPALETAVAEAMTINETSFFRDGRPFELLRTELLPRLIQARLTKRSLRFWSAACSSGQEAYSLAILMREHFPLLAGWDIRIEGSDISAEVVQRARAGRYHRIEMNRGLPARYLVRYFDSVGEDWVVKQEIRNMCNFHHANLCGPKMPWAHGGGLFDVVFLRNVMIYLSQDTRKLLLERIHRLLAPDGILFLGSTEQPPDMSLWETVLTGGTCHYRPKPR